MLKFPYATFRCAVYIKIVQKNHIHLNKPTCLIVTRHRTQLKKILKWLVLSFCYA